MFDPEEVAQIKRELDTIQNRCPGDIRVSLQVFAIRGPSVLGGFMRALLSNNLRDAVSRADNTNKAKLADIVTYCEHFLLPTTWGSQASLDAFQKRIDEEEATDEFLARHGHGQQEAA